MNCSDELSARLLVEYEGSHATADSFNVTLVFACDE